MPAGVHCSVMAAVDRSAEWQTLIMRTAGDFSNGLRNRRKSKADLTQASMKVEQETEELCSFVEQASGVLTNLTGAWKMATNCAVVESAGFQDLLGLCLERIASLRVMAEQREEQRRQKHGDSSQSMMHWLWSSNAHNDNANSTLDQVSQHEFSIVAYLQHQMGLLSLQVENLRSERDQRLQHQERLNRIRTKAASSVVVDSKQSQQNYSAMDLPVASERKQDEEEQFVKSLGLSPQQAAQLVHENEGLLLEYQEINEQVTRTAAGLHEITRLQNTLQEQLIYQSAQIDRIYDDAENMVSTMKNANEQLMNASKRRSSSVRFFIVFMIAATLLLLILHFASD